MVESGTTIRIMPARQTKAICQPKLAMKACPSGAKTNWPIEEAAVAMPKTKERFSCGTARPKAAITTPNEAVPMPMPMRTPPVR